MGTVRFMRNSITIRGCNVLLKVSNKKEGKRLSGLCTKNLFLKTIRKDRKVFDYWRMIWTLYKYVFTICSKG